MQLWGDLKGCTIRSISNKKVQNWMLSLFSIMFSKTFPFRAFKSQDCLLRNWKLITSFLLQAEHEKKKLLLTEEYQETMEEMPFLFLTCDLPPQPLYPDELQENIIPQVPFHTILAKFNGTFEKEYKTHKDSTLKRFELTKLPPYIIVYIKVRRFSCMWKWVKGVHW